jgi:DNA-binding LacI/PurR family transcriptional regulator
MALGAREALQAIGLSVPRDVLLVGYDDIPLARYVEPALTSVQGDMAEVGSVAASRLLELIGGRLPDEPVTLLPTELVVRNSCGCGRSST